MPDRTIADDLVDVAMERDMQEAWNKRLVEAAKRVDDAWDAWMMHEEGEGQEDMEQAIAHLRDVLRNG